MERGIILPGSPICTPTDTSPNIEDPSTAENFQAGDKIRDTQRPADILKALNLSTEDWVADVGAGDGNYSMQLSKLKNVVVVKGPNDDPNLPENALSGVLVVDAYHHFSHPDAMNQQIFKALRPGGRFVIADYSLPSK